MVTLWPFVYKTTAAFQVALKQDENGTIMDRLCMDQIWIEQLRFDQRLNARGELLGISSQSTASDNPQQVF